MFEPSPSALREGARGPLAVAVAMAGLLALAAPARAGQPPLQWTLADPPVFEVGRDGDVLLEHVGGAAVMADGSVLVADQGPRQVFRLSPAGRVIGVLGGSGQGPGEFGWLQHVFAEGDTIVAYDSGLRRVTVWRPGAEQPEIQSLPQVGGVPTSLRAVASPEAWILEANTYPAPGEKAGLKERRRELVFFDAAAGETMLLGARHMGYDYLLQIEGGAMASGLPFLGRAQVAGAGGRWLFAPMDDAVLEVWAPGGRSPERRIALPPGRSPYSRDAIRALGAEEAAAASREDAALARKQFDGVLDELPPLAPPVRQLVRMGRDVWVQPFSPGLEGAAEWLVVDPVAGTVRATVSVDPRLTLLAGSGEVAVLLGETDELAEHYVQVRRIMRAPGP